MSDYITVTCPHCACTSTYQKTIGGHGRSGMNCHECSKSFSIEYRNGSIIRITK